MKCHHSNNSANLIICKNCCLFICKHCSKDEVIEHNHMSHEVIEYENLILQIKFDNQINLSEIESLKNLTEIIDLQGLYRASDIFQNFSLDLKNYHNSISHIFSDKRISSISDLIFNYEMITADLINGNLIENLDIFNKYLNLKSAVGFCSDIKEKLINSIELCHLAMKKYIQYINKINSTSLINENIVVIPSHEKSIDDNDQFINLEIRIKELESENKELKSKMNSYKISIANEIEIEILKNRQQYNLVIDRIESFNFMKSLLDRSSVNIKLPLLDETETLNNFVQFIIQSNCDIKSLDVNSYRGVIKFYKEKLHDICNPLYMNNPDEFILNSKIDKFYTDYIFTNTLLIDKLHNNIIDQIKIKLNFYINSNMQNIKNLLSKNFFPLYIRLSNRNFVVKSIDLNGCRIEDKEIEYVVLIINKECNCSELFLQNNYISDFGIDMLFKGIPPKNSLRSIYLNNNTGITDDSLKYIYTTLLNKPKLLNKLQILCLENNKISKQAREKVREIKKLINAIINI